MQYQYFNEQEICDIVRKHVERESQGSANIVAVTMDGGDCDQRPRVIVSVQPFKPSIRPEDVDITRVRIPERGYSACSGNGAGAGGLYEGQDGSTQVGDR